MLYKLKKSEYHKFFFGKGASRLFVENIRLYGHIFIDFLTVVEKYSMQLETGYFSPKLQTSLNIEISFTSKILWIIILTSEITNNRHLYCYNRTCNTVIDFDLLSNTQTTSDIHRRLIYCILISRIKCNCRYLSFIYLSQGNQWQEVDI